MQQANLAATRLFESKQISKYLWWKLSTTSIANKRFWIYLNWEKVCERYFGRRGKLSQIMHQCLPCRELVFLWKEQTSVLRPEWFSEGENIKTSAHKYAAWVSVTHSVFWSEFFDCNNAAGNLCQTLDLQQLCACYNLTALGCMFHYVPMLRIIRLYVHPT